MRKGILTILGSGTSQGVPVIACDCNTCKSSNPKDNRTRSSVLIEVENKQFVIDTGPDFRNQMLRENVQYLNGVIFTHEHKDHIAGLDDVRAFNHKQNEAMKVYATAAVNVALNREYHYIFSEDSYPGIPKLAIQKIDEKPFQLSETFVLIPIQVMHYKMPVLGYRMGDLTYITDAKTIPEAEIEKVKGSKTLIINALHLFPHISHFNLEEALNFIELIQPESAYLTHISHLFGKHDDIKNLLPNHVFPAYDGLKINFNY
ncbi:MAG: MBL fold metallo-hydrolase [Crocinitomicaceae bacterium]